MNLGGLGAAKSDDKPQAKPVPALGGLGGVPSLRLGDVSRSPDPQPSADSASNKPKMGLGLGLDLSKA